jgi:Kef-type K+ transport system membrane component KefB
VEKIQLALVSAHWVAGDRIAMAVFPWLGIHLLFGAFLMGIIMPKDQRFVRYIVNKFETITVTLLLPLFFVFTGLRTTIGLLQGRQMWMYCGLIVLVATLGKLGGSMLASRVAGMPLRDAASLGTLMNTGA